MHILMMVAIGLGLLALAYLAARALGREGSSRIMARSAGLFALVWLLVCSVDFYVGIAVAGYSVGAEAAAHAVIFGVPAAAALALAIRASRRDPARPA